MTCLKRRRSSCICCARAPRRRASRQRAERARRRVVAQLDAHLRAAPARRRPRSARSRSSRRPHPSSERHAISSFGRSSMISASHSTTVPAGAFATQCERARRSARTDSRCAHEARQVLEVAPEAVDLLRRAVDRDRSSRRASRLGRRASAPLERAGSQRTSSAVTPADGRRGRGQPAAAGRGEANAAPRSARSIDVAPDARPEPAARAARLREDADAARDLAQAEGAQQGRVVARARRRSGARAVAARPAPPARARC